MASAADLEDGLPDEEAMFRDLPFDEVLEELNARFLVNLPTEELSLVRLYWQAEQAHWFYEDYLRPLNPSLPQLNQRQFTHLIIASSPLYSHLSSDDYDAIWEEYCRYKRMVPCCGAIILNEEGDKVLVVRGWKDNAAWSFPRGKINSEESEEACAIREVEEETGFNLAKVIKPEDRIQTQINTQTVTMFIVTGISEDTYFETQTRKEIGAIEWALLSELPTWTGRKGAKTRTQTSSDKKQKKFYNVVPFVGPLKRWMTEHGMNTHPKRRSTQPQPQQPPTFRTLEPFNFDASPAQSPQVPLRQPGAPQVASALDNLFQRFVMKQEEDLNQPEGRDNKAGLERLFGSIAPLEQELHAQPLDARRAAEKKEDDALARLLGGLSTATPAPTAPVLAPPTEKAGKLLAMLNAHPAPVSPPSQPPRVQPHQASLLAMLSTPPSNHATVASTDSSTQYAPNRGSLPASSGPATPSAEERARKQRALLESITLGPGLDGPSVPNHHPQQPTQQPSPHVLTENVLVDRQTGSGGPVTGQEYRLPPQGVQWSSPPSQPQVPQQHRPAYGQGYAPQHGSTSPGQASGAQRQPPPPPYDPVPQSWNQPAPASGPVSRGYDAGPYPPQPSVLPGNASTGFPMTNGPGPGHFISDPRLSHGLQAQPGNPNPLPNARGLGPAGPYPQQQGYRRVTGPQQVSGAGPASGPGTYGSAPNSVPQASFGPGPGPGYIRPPTGIPGSLPYAGIPNMPNAVPPWPQGYPPAAHGQNYSNGPLPGQPPIQASAGSQAYGPPAALGGGSQQRTPPRTAVNTAPFHHPVPRPPNSNAGVLLGMLNDGPR